MLNNDEHIVLRPKIARVRDSLNASNCVGMNPFLLGLEQAQLLEVFEEFSGDVKRAADALKDVTGVNPLTFYNVPSTAAFMARGFISHVQSGKSPEMVLSNAFQEYMSGPYFALRELEAMEAKNGSHCFGKAQKAMDGLGNLYALVKAVPLVYEHASQDAIPAFVMA